MSSATKAALASEISRLAKLTDPAQQIRVIGNFFADLDAELDRIGRIRLAAIVRLRGEGQTYEQIAQATGLSKARVAQLARQSGSGGRARRVRDTREHD